MISSPVFITGNQHKLVVLERLLGHRLKHMDIELDELQQLDIVKVTSHKALLAYELIKRPVLVEDVALVVDAFGLWPGTYIKLFLREMGALGICKMLDGFESRTAYAVVVYGFYDGKDMKLFEGKIEGSIPKRPRGEGGSGWDAIFIPAGQKKTFAEMNQVANDKELSYQIVRDEAVRKLKIFLDKSEA